MGAEFVVDLLICLTLGGGVGARFEDTALAVVVEGLDEAGALSAWLGSSLRYVVAFDAVLPAAFALGSRARPYGTPCLIKRPSGHDRVLPGLQVPSSAFRREGPGLRSAP